MWKFVIEGKPVSQKNSKRILKNRRTNASFIASNEKVLAWKRSAVLQLRRQYGDPPISGHLAVWCIFLQGRGQHVDGDNAEASVFDALQEAGVVESDYQFVASSWFRTRDRERPRVEIGIRRFAQKDWDTLAYSGDWKFMRMGD